jgi:hypothetical protein
MTNNKSIRILLTAAAVVLLAIGTLHPTEAFGGVLRRKVTSFRSATATYPTTSYRQQEIFSPIKGFFGSLLMKHEEFFSLAATSEFCDDIEAALTILDKAAETKTEQTDKVYTALLDLERLQRLKRKSEGTAFLRSNDSYPTAEKILRNLNGECRLIFTTGTKETQNKIGKINYFPIKAVQSFDSSVTPMKITNGIFVGDYAVLQFYGEFEFDLKKCKVEFDFDQIALFGFMINLGKGKAAEIGAASGLGSTGNTKLIEKKKKPFFNWISVDERIATARGSTMQTVHSL